MSYRTLSMVTLGVFLIACTDPPPGTAADYRQQLESTRETLRTIRAERDELAVQNAALSVAIKNGQYIAEKGKQLAVREAELNRREQRLTEKTQAQEQFAAYLQDQQTALYEHTVAIGEANQIKKEYEALRADKLKAEASRDRYLTAIFVLAMLFILLVGWLSYLRTRVKLLEYPPAARLGQDTRNRPELLGDRP